MFYHSTLINNNLFYFFDNHYELLEMEFHCEIHLARTSGTFEICQIKSFSALCLWRAREWLASIHTLSLRKRNSPLRRTDALCDSILKAISNRHYVSLYQINPPTLLLKILFLCYELITIYTY